MEEWQRQIDREREFHFQSQLELWLPRIKLLISWHTGQDEDSEKLQNIEKRADEILESLKETANNITEVKEIGLGKCRPYTPRCTRTDKAKAEELREMFKWLFDDESAGQQKTHKELRDAIEELESPGDQEGEGYRSGDWFINGKEYLEWKKYPQGLLWLYGNCRCLLSLSISSVC